MKEESLGMEILLLICQHDADFLGYPMQQLIFLSQTLVLKDVVFSS